MARGRKRQVRYWQRKGGGYFVTIDGAQHELALGPDDAPDGPTYAAAIGRYGKLLALDTNKGTDDYLVSALANSYRKFLKDKHPRRLDLFEQWSKTFIDLYGHMRCRELQPYHFDEWLDARATWGPTSRWNAGRKVLACINWGAKKGLIQRNHLLGRVQLPEPNVKGKEMRLPPELLDLLVGGAFHPRFGLFLRVLRETGCRPVELRMAEVGDFRGDRIVFLWNSKGYRHKTSAKTKRDRVIYLTGELASAVREHAGARKAGRLFLTPRGKPYKNSNLHKLFEKVKGRGAVRECMAGREVEEGNVTLYAFRHTFACEFLDSGRSIKVCAEIMGTSVAMLERVYYHGDQRTIHEHYNQFMASKK